MKNRLLLFLGFSLPMMLNAQKLVTLSHNGTSIFFTGNTPIQEAVVAATSGDTIYIPGGGFTIGTLLINKSLTIYGVGHVPDSTLATYRTELTGTMVIVQGASNTHLEGFYLTGDINFGTDASNQFVENIKIRRVNLNTLRLSYDGSTVTTSNNIVVTENWIRGELHAGYASGVLVQQNLIAQGFRYASNALFTNNILIGGYCANGPFSGVDNCLFQNNYLYAAFSNCWGNFFISGNTNQFYNNATNHAWALPDGTNTGMGNWFSIPITSFFVNCPSATFDYTYDYHLQTPAGFMGTDATEIGIYGTAAPFKSGSIPENPHISTKNIAPQTNTNGELNINITVGAQND